MVALDTVNVCWKTVYIVAPALKLGPVQIAQLPSNYLAVTTKTMTKVNVVVDLLKLTQQFTTFHQVL